ncbi:MAG: PrgI family protein [bacterium]
MQQFVVPQFIDVEDKIIGPITVRQFIIMLAGFLMIAIFYKLFDFSMFLTFGLLTLVISGVISFVKINGRPFHYFILNLAQTLRRPKLRVWRNGFLPGDYEGGAIGKDVRPAAVPVLSKRYTASRLAELSLIVDTKGAYKGESGKSGEAIARK